MAKPLNNGEERKNRMMRKDVLNEVIGPTTPDIPNEHVRILLQFEEIKRLTDLAWNTKLSWEQNAPDGYLRDMHDIIHNWSDYLDDSTKEYKDSGSIKSQQVRKEA